MKRDITDLKATLKFLVAVGGFLSGLFGTLYAVLNGEFLAGFAIGIAFVGGYLIGREKEA